jgi:small subunit ribosomal protein S6
MQEVLSKRKSSYETVVVFSLKNGESAVSSLVEKFKGILSSSAELGSVDEWGKRRLVYPIDKENEGYYVLFKFKSDTDFPAELNRIYRITEGILRSLIVNLDETEHRSNLRPKRSGPVKRFARDVAPVAGSVTVSAPGGFVSDSPVADPTSSGSAPSDLASDNFIPSNPSFDNFPPDSPASGDYLESDGDSVSGEFASSNLVPNNPASNYAQGVSIDKPLDIGEQDDT